MSCIRFNTPAQRAQMAANAPRRLTPEEVAERYRSPEFGESKIARLRLLAQSPVAKIREAAAASLHAPEELLQQLVHDDDAGVRAWVARNNTASCDILRELADDEDEKVRAFVALNWWVPEDAMRKLLDDESETVRALARWKGELAA